MDAQPASDDKRTGATSRNRRYRYVTVLFADLSDSSGLAERLDAEEYSDLLDDFREVARQVISRHGGTIARAQGDGLLALFGHLKTREDDGRRAAEAALELHAASARLRAGGSTDAPGLRVHSGIHSGLVLVADGDIERGRYDVIGEVANTAARLCSMAATGEILASEETLGPQRSFFSTTESRDHPIRGREEKLTLLRIHARTQATRRFEAAAAAGGRLPFVGRDVIMRELHGAAQRASAGEPQALMITGEAGIGKTRLLEEFQRALDPTAFRLLSGYCENYLGAEPLQPFLQWVRQAAGRSAGDAGNEGDPAAAVKMVGNLAQLVTAALDILSVVAQDKTLVLVLDDWQWADDATRAALQELLARQMRMLVLLAGRPDGDPLIPIPTLHLEPFDAAESTTAISGWLQAADPFLGPEIHRLSGGNPLFIEELCHAAGHGDLRLEERVNVAWINALVASRVLRLPDDQAELLQAASVAGTAFPEWLLGRAMAGANVEGLLQRLVVADFLASAGQPGVVRFKHVLTREAVYATVPPSRRRSIHLQLALALEEAARSEAGFEWLEALSYHYSVAGVSEKAARFAESAGDKALQAQALDRARAHYMNCVRALDAVLLEAASELQGDELATRLMPLRRRWCAVAQKLGHACVFDPLGLREGFQLFERATRMAELTGDRNVIARARYWLAYVNYSRGRPREAVRHAQLALDHADVSGDAKLVAQVKATLGQSLASAGRYDEALPLLAHAVNSKRAQSRESRSAAIGSAYSLARTGYTLGDLGCFDEAEAAFAEARQLFGDELHVLGASVSELIAAVYLWQGRWAEAEAAALQGVDIALRCRSRYLVCMGRALGACAGWVVRRDEASLQTLRASTAWIEEQGGAVSTSLNYGWLVEVTASLGLGRETRAHAARLFQRVRAQDRHGEAMGCRALARLAAAQGNAARVERYLRAADAAASFRGSRRELAVNQLARAEIALVVGTSAEAAILAESAAATFDAMKMSWHRARAGEVLAPFKPAAERAAASV